nr:MAG TPA: DNA-binding transcriptional regulator [Caudoviricetes sp.]
MFHCPKCHFAAHARTSRYFTDTTKERYHQCTNINCSATFVTTETVERFIVSPGSSPSASASDNIGTTTYSMVVI